MEVQLYFIQQMQIQFIWEQNLTHGFGHLLIIWPSRKLRQQLEQQDSELYIQKVITNYILEMVMAMIIQ